MKSQRFQPELDDEQMPSAWRPDPDPSAWSLRTMYKSLRRALCFFGFHRLNPITSEWIGTHIVNTFYRCQYCPYSEKRHALGFAAIVDMHLGQRYAMRTVILSLLVFALIFIFGLLALMIARGSV